MTYLLSDLHEKNPRFHPRRGRQPGICGKDLTVQGFCQNNVGGIIRTEIISQFPNSILEWLMRISLNLEILKIFASAPGQVYVYLPESKLAAKAAQDLQINQVRRANLAFMMK